MKRPLSPVEPSPTKKCRIELDSPASDALNQTAMHYHCDDPKYMSAFISDIEEAYDSSVSNQEFSPIYRLNPDTLARIFSFLANEWPTTYSRVTVDWHIERYVQLNWARVLHVCHFFRAVALDCAPLWSSLDLSSPKWTELQLRRCKNVDVTVNIPGETIPDSDITEWTEHLLSVRLGYMRELRLDMWDDDSEQDAIHYLCGPGVSAPKLESLTLSRGGLLTDRIYPNENALFIDLLSGGSPQLQKLSLFKCTVPWSAPIFNSSITILEIMSCYNNPTKNFGSFSDLLDALDRMHALKVLFLAMSFPELTEAESKMVSSRIVKLPHLEVLMVRSEAPGFTELLRFIAFPSFANVNIDWNYGPEAPTSAMVQELFSAIHYHGPLYHPKSTSDVKQSKNAFVIKRLEIILDETEPDVRDGYGVQVTPIFTLTDSSKFHSKDFTWTIVFDRNDSDLVDLLSSMALEELESVTLNVDVSDAVFDSLAELPALKSMTLRQNAGAAFLAYICKIESVYPTDSEQDSDNVTLGVDQEEATSLKFPKLKGLCFEHVPFRYYAEVDVPDNEENRDDKQDQNDQEGQHNEEVQDNEEDQGKEDHDDEKEEEMEDQLADNNDNEDDEMEDQDNEGDQSNEESQDSEDDQDDDEGQNDLPMGADIQDLVYFFKRRLTSTSPIEGMSFWYCNITPEMGRELSALVNPNQSYTWSHWNKEDGDIDWSTYDMPQPGSKGEEDKEDKKEEEEEDNEEEEV
ncbi:hypothetical protein CVT24_009606 [Panaeolus cyanescens]|uniref:F-box domain-containing protein n=1 Tax=Panaeolus cyanescens TaxID=181874 RepID=A0A409YA29_9AGAR|nr:hypothetical protein CVT24_009606 [Panaeolus cyanescens]